MSLNKIYKCFWFQAEIFLKSPMIIGNGMVDHTDDDLLTDAAGQPFIPGSSLAGVIREGITKGSGINKRDFDWLMGDDCINHKQSSIFIYDAPLIHPADIGIRDGIEINEYTKTTKDKSKYDFEVLNPGASFRFRMEIILREQDLKPKDDKNKDKYLPPENINLMIKQFISDVIEFVEKDDFRIGAKTSRGYGRLGMKNIEYYDLTLDHAEAVKKYLEFQWEDMCENNKLKFPLKQGGSNILPESTYHSPYTTLKIPMAVESTLLIRQYYLSNFSADSEQITVDGRAVVPGSSWAGVFRHKIMEFLTELQDENTARALNEELFGSEKISDIRKKSRIIFEESVDEDNIDTKRPKFKEITRNKIDRFTGGVLKTGLFSENVAIGGQFTLEMKVYKAMPYEIGMLLLAGNELTNGLVAIGGTTSIGRGTMRKHGQMQVNGRDLSEKEQQRYWDALKSELDKRGRKHEV